MDIDAYANELGQFYKRYENLWQLGKPCETLPHLTFLLARRRFYTRLKSRVELETLARERARLCVKYDHDTLLDEFGFVAWTLPNGVTRAKTESIACVLARFDGFLMYGKLTIDEGVDRDRRW